MPSPALITHRFTYHPPTEAQALKYTEIRGRALALALRLNELIPDSPELSLALTKLDEMVMHANAGIARTVLFKDDLPSEPGIEVPVETGVDPDASTVETEPETDLIAEMDRAAADTLVEAVPIPVDPPEE